MANLTGFRITGLHGHRDISITIRDNCVILVGVNGLGKTTIINLLYYLLTRQWVRLVEYKFEALAIDIDKETLSISREQIEGPLVGTQWKRRLARYSPHLARALGRNPQLISAIASAPNDPLFLRALADDVRIPFPALMEFRALMEEEPLQQELFGSASEIKKFEERLSALFQGQVLYLPTYRRIERDLEKIFPGLEEEIHRRRVPRSARESAYLEFVEFGMRDVEKRLADLLAALKERARSELNNLAASYLGEVIRGEADSYDTTLFGSLDDATIERILNRVEERDILYPPDRGRLREVISRLKGSETGFTPQEKYVGHFFSKLAAIHRSLADAEAAVGSFVEVCNGYLVGKRIVFDDRKYAININQSQGEEPLQLRHLSSGEKQIVSLFTHVYLGDAPDLVVLIDEPELSLSVPWQQKLLPDIRRSNRCRFLAAVTHSPFIYDNELKPYATDLQECIAYK